MSVSIMKAISLLAFVLINCESGFSRPHPENFKRFAKREIYFSNPIFNNVFRNRNPEKGLIRKFLGDDGSDITNNKNNYYVFRILIDDNLSKYYVDQNGSGSEVMDQNTDNNPVTQKTSTELIGQNTDQNPIIKDTTTKDIGQNPDQIPIKQETSTEVISKSPDQNLIKQQTSTGVIDQNPDQNQFEQKTSTGVMDQNPDQKPIKESLQVAEIHQGDLETPSHSFIVVPDEVKRGQPVPLKAENEDDTKAEKYTTENFAFKNSKGCVPRFQSQIAIEEQKMLTYFNNLVEPQANQNKKNVPNLCQENETVTDIQENTNAYSAENSKYIYNKFSSQEPTNQLNFDKKPAPLESQPNTLVREDDFFLYREEQEKKPHRATNNVESEQERVSSPLVPIIPYILESNSTVKNALALAKDVLDSHETNEVSNNHPDETEDFEIGSPVPIIPYKPAVQINTTPNPQRNPEISFKIYESEISKSKEKKTDIEKTRTTTYPAAVDVETDTTLKPQSSSPGSLIASESEDKKRPNRSTNLLVEKSNITEPIEHHYDTIKPQKGKGFISSNIKFIEKNDKPLNKKSDKLSTVAEYIQKHNRNLTNEAVQKFSNDVLELWSNPKSNQLSRNGKTLSTSKPNVRVDKKEMPNSVKLLKNSSNGVSASGLAITRLRYGTAVPKRRTPAIRRGIPAISRGTSGHRLGTSASIRGTDQDGLLVSILSRVLQTVIRTGNRTPTIPNRIRRDLRSKRNKYVLKSIARKFFAPKYFPKSGKNVFAIPGGSAVETLPSNFRQGNYDSIQKNLVDSNLETKKVITLADIFNSDYLRTARSNKLKHHSEEFEQIM